MRSPDHLSRSSEAKNPKNPKKAKCVRRTDGPTKRGVESRSTRLKRKISQSRNEGDNDRGLSNFVRTNESGINIDTASTLIRPHARFRGKYRDLRFKRKQGRYTATLVACGWAGAVLEKVTRASGQEPYAQKTQKRRKSKKGDRPTDRPTDRRTDIAGCRVA